NNMTKNYKGQVEKYGVSANEKSIDRYFSLINAYTNTYWNSIDIPVILQQWGAMTYGNQGKFDLGVATGFCEMAAEFKGVDVKPNVTEKEEEVFDDFITEHSY